MASKKPADRKIARHPKTEKFTWDNGDGITLTVPYLENLRMGAVRRAAEIEGVAQVYMLLQECGIDTDEVDDLTQGEFEEFFETWQNESASDLGESSAS